MAFLPAVSAQQSAHTSDSNLNQNVPNGGGPADGASSNNNMILQSSSLISSSSSANSSTLASPALINNNGSVLQFPQINDAVNLNEYQQQHSWPSGK